MVVRRLSVVRRSVGPSLVMDGLVLQQAVSVTKLVCPNVTCSMSDLPCKLPCVPLWSHCGWLVLVVEETARSAASCVELNVDYNATVDFGCNDKRHVWKCREVFSDTGCVCALGIVRNAVLLQQWIRHVMECCPCVLLACVRCRQFVNCLARCLRGLPAGTLAGVVASARLQANLPLGTREAGAKMRETNSKNEKTLSYTNARVR